MVGVGTRRDPFGRLDGHQRGSLSSRTIIGRPMQTQVVGVALECGGQWGLGIQLCMELERAKHSGQPVRRGQPASQTDGPLPNQSLPANMNKWRRKLRRGDNYRHLVDSRSTPSVYGGASVVAGRQSYDSKVPVCGAEPSRAEAGHARPGWRQLSICIWAHLVLLAPLR